MTFLYFLLDVCFYNYTFIKTDFLLHALLEKKESKFMYFISIMTIDFLLLVKGKLFLLFLILYGINKILKLSYQNIKEVFLRFCLLYLIYKLGVYVLFKTFVFDCLGFAINFLVLYVFHKKFFTT